jgi:hypothetical protein
VVFFISVILVRGCGNEHSAGQADKFIGSTNHAIIKIRIAPLSHLHDKG